MRPRLALCGAVGMSLLFLGLVPTTAGAKAGTPVTVYAYEEIGPHSLLADPSAGVQYMEPTCTPDFTNCVTYEFDDGWDVAATPSETDDTNVVGYLENHGVDNFVRHTVKGTLTLTMGGVTWTGGYSGTFTGRKAATGSFSLLGTDGTKYAGTVYFLDDGLMELMGTVR